MLHKRQTPNKAGKAPRPEISLVERLMSHSSRQAYAKRDKLDKMKEDLERMKSKLETMPKGIDYENWDEYRQRSFRGKGR